MKYQIFGLGFLQVLLTGLLFTYIGHLSGLSFSVAFIAGFGLSLSSTAFSLQILEEHHQLKTLHGQGSFSILLFQDLAIVPLIALVPIVAGIKSSTVNAYSILETIAILTGFTLFSLYFIRYFFRFIAQSRVPEIFIATALLVVLGSALLMEEYGLSMGTGAFLAGVLLANSEYRHELEVHLEPFKSLLLGLFFMAVGMALDLNVLVTKPHWILLLVVSFMFLKSAVIFVLARLFKYPYESSRNMAFTLPQGGEFAFVLFASAGAIGIMNGETSAILNASVTISMALTPMLFKLNQRFLRTFSEVSEKPYDTIASEGAEVIIAGYGRFGQIVSRFLQTQGISFTILEHSAEQVEAARKFGAKIFYGDASRKDIVKAAGGKEAKIFILAVDDPEVSASTALMVQNHFPNLKIIARVRNRQHAIQLLGAGIEDVHRETYLTSLEVAKNVLLQLGQERPVINKRLALFREHDERILREQLAYQENEKDFISFTNRANEELENILKQDQKNT